ncbi:winged helix-turn-helix transcriptional regulator [Paenibacillus lautus]|uniref:winged helix-turn-helix transcriptional regulator n=1 Tax=Paenibacillus lautus TaxID=1401 RepID=UPI001C7DC4FD|nr:helix-turn-helix domain-containing protein [Paenibacillus lautus]MBX4147135.1 helix-turn-helix transcriptional regulator [Paenibacillus lautus]
MELLESEQRYNELHRQINGISQKVLSGVLKELVADGLVERTVYPEIKDFNTRQNHLTVN